MLMISFKSVALKSPSSDPVSGEGPGECPLCLFRQGTMAQLGFFDAEKRLEALSAKGDPLEAIDRLVPWESFRAEIEAVGLTPDELKKSAGSRLMPC
jgi:hypothetical protein